jgi:hypothetical protein
MAQLAVVTAVSVPARSARANALAERLERGAQALGILAASLTDAEWKTPITHDGRTIGVVVHHVATMYPLEIELAQVLASGQPVVGVTIAKVHEINAAHAAAHAHVTKSEALLLLQKTSTLAAAAIRAFGDEELDSAAPASLYGNAPITCQFMLEDHAVRHSYHHLAKIRETLGLGE